MLALNHDRMEKSTGHVLHDLGGALLAPLALIGNGSYRVIRWLQDEWHLNATNRELSRLNDYYLDDIGIRRRPIDLRHDELIKRMRAGG